MPARAATNAERQRRYRARVRQHRFVVPVELTEERLDVLTAVWLDETDAGDPSACGEAIGRILDGLAKNPLRVTPKVRHTG